MSKKVKKSPLLILMRHGESVWNQKNIFTGWVDVALSEKGVEEAIEGGKKIKEIPIDVAFTSTLIRAQMTLFLALLNHSSGKVPAFRKKLEKSHHDWDHMYSHVETIPTFASWHLNERMYGELQGKNKQEMADQYGKEQVQIWRRSFDVAPPKGESLKMTSERTLPYFEEEIVPWLNKKNNVFIAAHGNSLRSIVMKIENLSSEAVVKLEIPTGEPLFYYFNGKSFEKIPYDDLITATGEWKKLSKEERVQLVEKVLDQEIRPFVALDRGGVILVDIPNETDIIIRYEGSCVGCHAALGSTLMAIQEVLREKISKDLVVIPKMDDGI